ncbi:MAG: hypothetical protein HY423_09010 [Candidatus Lambdaproteobacteria bacterium]|nr:hypothetical protein [Candidatus Lambdaproteobacteria bacterium]
MPITQERQTIQDLRRVGFSEEQALLLAAKLEGAAQATSQDLKAFIVPDLDRRFGALGIELERQFAALSAELERRAAEVDRRFGAVDARFERLEAHMETRFAQMDAHFQRSLRLHLATILSAFVAVTGLAVAILKLFPGPGG